MGAATTAMYCSPSGYSRYHSCAASARKHACKQKFKQTPMQVRLEPEVLIAITSHHRRHYGVGRRCVLPLACHSCAQLAGKGVPAILADNACAGLAAGQAVMLSAGAFDQAPVVAVGEELVLVLLADGIERTLAQLQCRARAGVLHVLLLREQAKATFWAKIPKAGQDVVRVA